MRKKETLHTGEQKERMKTSQKKKKIQSRRQLKGTFIVVDRKKNNLSLETLIIFVTLV